ncbi:MAG: glycosyltransferase family 2 protein [Ignavibacteriota bacterium]
MAYPRVGIILVHLNSYSDTSLCLTSLRSITYPNVEVIVVDNGSIDHTGERLRKEFPEITHIRSEDNFGFSGGNNIGIDHALSHGCEHVLLLNNDTIVTPSFLEPLVDRLLQEKNVAAVSGKIYYYPERVGGRKKIIWYAGVFQKWHTGYHHTGVQEVDEGQFDVAMKVIYASGCLMLMNGEVIRKIGGLDPEFFIYWEESDWCLRAKEIGYDCWYEPRSVIDHNFRSAPFGRGETPFYMYMQMRNSFIFAKRHFHGRIKLRHHLFYPLYIAYYFTTLVWFRNFRGARAIILGIIDYFKGYSGKKGLKERGYIKV